MRSICFLPFLFLVIIPSSALTLFEDEFCTSDNWVELNIPHAVVTLHTDRCDLVVRDSGLNAAILHHDMNLPGNFSYEVTLHPLSATFTRAGIAFNLTQNQNGYLFSINSQRRYQIAVMTNGLSLVLSSNIPNPSINPAGLNTLKVDRIGNEIHFSCNGNYLERIVDGTYSGGGVGIMVGANSTVRFVSAGVTDRPDPGSRVTCIKDSFFPSANLAWSTEYRRGTHQVSGGELVYSNTGASSTGILYHRGSFEQASIRAEVSIKQGTAMGGIGFIDLYFLADGSPAYRLFGFFVNAQRQYAFLNSSGGSVPLKGPSSHLRGHNDTLEMRRSPTGYELYANGAKLEEVTRPADFSIDGVALVVQPNVVASFGDFRAGNPACIGDAPVNRLRSAYSGDVRQSHSLAVYDARGRKCPTPDSDLDLSSGVYYFSMPLESGWNARRTAVTIRDRSVQRGRKR